MRRISRVPMLGEHQLKRRVDELHHALYGCRAVKWFCRQEFYRSRRDARLPDVPQNAARSSTSVQKRIVALPLQTLGRAARWTDSNLHKTARLVTTRRLASMKATVALSCACGARRNSTESSSANARTHSQSVRGLVVPLRNLTTPASQNFA